MPYYMIEFRKTETVAKVVEAESIDDAQRIGNELLDNYDFFSQLNDEMEEVYEPEWDAFLHPTWARMGNDYDPSKDWNFLTKKFIAEQLDDDLLCE